MHIAPVINYHLLAATLLCVICRPSHCAADSTRYEKSKVLRNKLKAPVFVELDGQMPHGILHIVGFIMRLQRVGQLAGQSLRIGGHSAFY